jgi:hypothetical protein
MKKTLESLRASTYCKVDIICPWDVYEKVSSKESCPRLEVWFKW